MLDILKMLLYFVATPATYLVQDFLMKLLSFVATPATCSGKDLLRLRLVMMVPLGLRLVLFGNTSRCCPSTSVLLACTRSLRTLLMLALSAEPYFATPLVWGPLVGPHYRWGRHRGRPVLDVMHGGSNRAPRMRCRPPVGRQSIRVHRQWHIPSAL